MIVRGLRAVADFEYEYQMAGMNQQINPRVETVFLMADVSLQPIASRLVKEIALYGGPIDRFVTPRGRHGRCRPCREDRPQGKLTRFLRTACHKSATVASDEDGLQRDVQIGASRDLL